MTQVQLPVIRRKVLGDQLADHLFAMPGPKVGVFRGDVSADGRWPQVPNATGPDKLPDSDRVAPYVVLFDGAGPTDLEPDLGGMNEDLAWRPGITVAAGFSPDCTQTVDRVCAWIYRWSPVLPGAASGLLVPLPGFDPGQVRPDRTVSPIRFFLPTQWQLVVTT